MNSYRKLLEQKNKLLKENKEIPFQLEKELIDVANCICCLITTPKNCQDCKWKDFLIIRQEELAKVV